MKNKKTPKVLMIDIETRPAVAYVWQVYKANISPEQIIDHGGTICFGAKWLGDKKMMFYSDWQHGHEEMIKQAHRLMNEADAIVTYNGDKFDIPKLMGEFIQQGLTPPAPPTSIDVLKTVRKLGFVMNRLAFIGPMLKLGAKLKHSGFSLWTDVLAGKPKAQTKMEKYCKQDVILLEQLYKKVLPYIRNHPNVRGAPSPSCGACGSTKTQKRGFRYTKAFRIQRMHCTNCGSWHDGTREKIK